MAQTKKPKNHVFDIFFSDCPNLGTRSFAVQYFLGTGSICLLMSWMLCLLARHLYFLDVADGKLNPGLIFLYAYNAWLTGNLNLIFAYIIML